jgi:hypothetical protein
MRGPNPRAQFDFSKSCKRLASNFLCTMPSMINLLGKLYAIHPARGLVAVFQDGVITRCGNEQAEFEWKYLIG